MKYVPLLIVALLASCSFEEEVEQAANECETKVREVFEEFEEKFGYICLTEEEIMDFLEENTVKEGADVENPRVAVRVLPYYSAAKNRIYGIYDPVYNICTYSIAH